jgi:glycosyltransferase involved in cell wall biosynthesis
MAVAARSRVVVLGGYARSLTLFRGPLLAAMVARGHHVTAMAADPDAETTRQLAAMGVAFEEIPLARTSLDPRRDLATLLHLRRRLADLAPDAVFAYTIKPIIYGLMAARLAGLAAGAQPRRYAMITGLGYAFMGQESRARRALAAVVARLYRAGLDGADALFFQNPDDRNDVTALGITRGVRRIELVRGSGVDVDEYPLTPLPEGPVRFLFAGRLLREKGFPDYVEMARLVRQRNPERDVHFDVLGRLDPNPTSFSAEELARWRAEGIVEYHGEVADIRPFLARSHVIVLPSYREGTPRAVLEAMSMGRAAIVTDVPGCREVVNATPGPEQTGLLVPPRDPAALAAAALALLAEPARLAAMAAAGRRRAVALYDARAVAAAMLDVMQL